ncbi:hypothetical protein [Chryseobacterium sp.]|uniref:hypothetical protein n=1 Tax=Chryseobacterium sp. TaxID=1871047 RepID=UPI00289EDAC2|nr:hypothetical protein [Chryseobacterium sp.]
MSFIKWLLEIIIATIIIFFVWNMLKRIFLNKFYKFTGFKPQNNQQQETQTSNATLEKKVKWDAETVEYEEVSETKNKS